MADKKNDKYLSLYPEDFQDRIWEEVCEVLEICPIASEVRIYFTSDDVIAIEE